VQLLRCQCKCIHIVEEERDSGLFPELSPHSLPLSLVFGRLLACLLLNALLLSSPLVLDLYCLLVQLALVSERLAQEVVDLLYLQQFPVKVELNLT